MSLLPRLLPNGNVLVPKLVQGTDDLGNEYYGDALVEIEPTHPNYAAARAEAERFAKFVELEDEQFANTRDRDPDPDVE